jgi:hypothetical protein
LGHTPTADAEYQAIKTMRVIATMCCKNEEYIAGLSVRVALMWNDAIVVLLHDCTDRSEEIIHDVAEEVGRERVIILKTDGHWAEMQHRMLMLEAARSAGATHISIVDFDELLSGNLIKQNGFGQGLFFTRGYLQPGQMFQLPLYNLRGSLSQYHSSGVWGCNRFLSLAFVDDPCLCWQGDRFHLREPQGATLAPYKPIQHGEGGVMHLWGCSERRLRARHAYYKCVETLRWPNKPVRDIEIEYNLWRTPEDAAAKWPMQTDWAKPWIFADVPASWWAGYEDLMKYLDLEATPWQEEQVRRLVAEHGAQRFAGLDLFGVA